MGLRSGLGLRLRSRLGLGLGFGVGPGLGLGRRRAQVAVALLESELVHEARAVGEPRVPLWRRRRELVAEALELGGELAQLQMPRLLRVRLRVRVRVRVRVGVKG